MSNDKPVKIAATANTLAPAWRVLVSKGWDVERHYDEPTERWTAKRGPIELSAQDVLQLLGLVCVYNSRGDEWRPTDDEVRDFLKVCGSADDTA